MYKSYNDKMENILPLIESESVDAILTDPPYLYLKNQKLDKQFDEELLFNEAKRILKRNGFIVLFGRGTSFYRWNTMLADLGFTFKEEIVWNKSYNTSPLMALSRVHETVSIFTKGKGIINKVKVPYLEMKSHDLNSVVGDVKRMRSILKNTKSLDAVLAFLEDNIVPTDKENTLSTSISSIVKTQDRCASVLNGITNGVNEKSIIKVVRDHYSAIHPTQKPVRLLERLLALVLPKDVEQPTVLDPFAGSFSTGVAAINVGCYPILIELDKEYYEKGIERIEKDTQQLQLF